MVQKLLNKPKPKSFKKIMGAFVISLKNVQWTGFYEMTL